MEDQRSISIGTGSDSVTEENLEPEFSLPEDLMRRVIARLPYPDLIWARCLSKRWRELLAGNSSEPEVKSFHDEIGSVTGTWPSFAPVVKVGKCFYAFDSVAGAWRSITTNYTAQRLAFMVEVHGGGYLTGFDAWEDDDERTHKWEEVVLATHCAGSLVCCFESTYAVTFRFRSSIARDDARKTVEWTRHGITVVNLVTGISEALIPSPVTREGNWRIEDRFFHAVKDGYIIALLESNRNFSHLELSFQIFDSREGCWRTDSFEKSECFFPGDFLGSRVSAYSRVLEESKVYVFACNCIPPVFVQFDCSARAWSSVTVSDEIAFSIQEDSSRWLLCGPRSIIVRETQVYGPHRIRLLEYFHTSESFVTLEEEYEVNADCYDYSVDYASDEEHIYIGVIGEEGTELNVHSYNLGDGEWKQLPKCAVESLLQDQKLFQWVRGSYSPGVNPFCNPAVVVV